MYQLSIKESHITNKLKIEKIVHQVKINDKKHDTEIRVNRTSISFIIFFNNKSNILLNAILTFQRFYCKEEKTVETRKLRV